MNVHTRILISIIIFSSLTVDISPPSGRCHTPTYVSVLVTITCHPHEADGLGMRWEGRKR